jgi:hypothetical protein
MDEQQRIRIRKSYSDYLEFKEKYLRINQELENAVKRREQRTHRNNTATPPMEIERLEIPG